MVKVKYIRSSQKKRTATNLFFLYPIQPTTRNNFQIPKNDLGTVQWKGGGGSIFGEFRLPPLRGGVNFVYPPSGGGEFCLPPLGAWIISSTPPRGPEIISSTPPRSPENFVYPPPFKGGEYRLPPLRGRIISSTPPLRGSRISFY